MHAPQGLNYYQRLSLPVPALAGRLRVLDLQHACTVLPDAAEVLGALAALSALTQLNCSSNSLGEVPVAWSRLTQLQVRPPLATCVCVRVRVCVCVCVGGVLLAPLR